MTMMDKIAEKANYYMKCLYAIYMGQWRNFRDGIRAASLSEWRRYAEINLSSARPTDGPLPISAIMRVKNAEASLCVSVEAIAYYCNEIILVDHMSADGTWEIMSALSKKYPGRVKAFKYELSAAKAGEGYLNRVESGEGSLADYYNFCFSLGTEKYLLKWDADNLAIPPFYKYFKRAIDRDCDIVYFDGFDVMGVYSCTNEGRLFKRDLAWEFRDFPYCEGLVIDGKAVADAKLRRYNVFVPTFFHLRQLV